MITYKYPEPEQLETITKRPQLDQTQLYDTVRTVIDDVRRGGDQSVKAYEEKFDHVSLNSLQVTENEFNEAEKSLDDELKQALIHAHDNIRRFHLAQRQEPVRIETDKGIECWQQSVAIEKVGLYIPGGTAPLFSTVLMLATPAKIAGCREIVLCTPPDRNGNVNPAILYAARVAGVSQIYKAGGIQAIAAMAYGTQTIPRVNKIFGPGNQYVMAAKQLVTQQGVAIDMPAGPSEVCVIADHTANPVYVAADLLSQAEHGADSQVLLITTDPTMADLVHQEIERQLPGLPRQETARKALAASKTVLVHDTDEAISISNAYAPEHLIIATSDHRQLATRVVNAGSVFLGNYACESAGDYASGTNHTLPTHGYAASYSGVNLDAFNKKITFQHITPEGIRTIGKTVETLARHEGLHAHENAMRVRRLSPNVPLPCKEEQGEETLNSQLSTLNFQLSTFNFQLSTFNFQLSTFNSLLRPNILSLTPYSCARDEYKGQAKAYLDANENPYNSPWNRYPDPLQQQLKAKVSEVKGVPAENIFLGNGSDEAIDIAYRVFCQPRIDNVVAIEPTYGMYKVCADINEVEYRAVPLDSDYQPDVDAILRATDNHTKLLWLCTPNNPTGNALSPRRIDTIMSRYHGITVIDEAYSDFSTQPTYRTQAPTHPRLIVLNTMSKAWGSAAIRLGIAYAHRDIIAQFNKVKYPYNVNLLTQQHALQQLSRAADVDTWVRQILRERTLLMQAFSQLPACRHVYPTDANFFLARMTDATAAYNHLIQAGIVVRNRTNITLCADCLRITVGTRTENAQLLAALRDYKP